MADILSKNMAKCSGFGARDLKLGVSWLRWCVFRTTDKISWMTVDITIQKEEHHRKMVVCDIAPKDQHFNVFSVLLK